LTSEFPPNEVYRHGSSIWPRSPKFKTI
jgi:hypothetical protein